MDGQPQRREIDLHRRVCVITPDTIDIKPARSAAIAPLLGFILGVLAFVAVLFWIEKLPFPFTLALMACALILVPFSGMGFVYSVYGANVVVNRAKRTALWQQGLFGMGVGTQELVPFEKIDRIELEELSSEEQQGRAQDFAQYEVRLWKVSGRDLSLGQITVPREAAAEGLARTRGLAEAVAEMTGKPLEVNVVDDASPRPKRRRRSQKATA
jgi:hypothetical protein